MYSVDEILHAATVISSTLPRIEARNLVLHHRKELQFAFDSLGLALQSGSPRESSPSRPDRLAESLNALPSAQPQTQQPNTSYQTHHDHCQQTVNTYDHSRQNPEVLLSTHQQRPTHLLQSDSPDTRRRGSAEADTEQREANTEDHETNTEDHEANTEDTKAVLTLVEKLEKDHEKIKLFAGLSEEAAISRGNNWTTQEDPRYTDIQLATKTCSMSQRFRAWIAQYSFADDYLTWAETTSGEPRQSFFTLDAKNSKTKGKSQNKRVSHYLRAINKKTEVTRKSIQYGLKYHSFEYIYGNSGVSAFLFAVPTAFRLLSYPHLRLLADSISRSKVWSALAVDKRDWLCNCIAMYNQDCAEYRDRRRGQKRHLVPERLEQSRSKRSNQAPMTNLTMETSISATQDARPDIHQALRSTPTHNECAPSEMPGFNLDDYHSPTDYNPWEADFDFLVPDLDNSTTELTRDLLTVIPGQSSHIENVLGGTPMFLSPPSNSNVPQTVHCTS